MKISWFFMFIVNILVLACNGYRKGTQWYNFVSSTKENLMMKDFMVTVWFPQEMWIPRFHNTASYRTTPWFCSALPLKRKHTSAIFLSIRDIDTETSENVNLDHTFLAYNGCSSESLILWTIILSNRLNIEMFWIYQQLPNERRTFRF